MVEAEIGPIRGQLASLERPFRAVCDDQGRAVVAEDVVDAGSEPAWVTELERVAMVARGALEHAGEPGVVPLEVLRKLPEDRAELAGFVQRPQRVEEKARAALLRLL